MLIDSVTILLLLFATIKGWRSGLVIALFSVFSFVIGLAAALKLSVTVASKIGSEDNRWLPFLSFLLIFILTAIVVKIVARIIQSGIEWAMMGWLNKLGGVLFYVLLYIFIISIFLFYGTAMGIIKQDDAHAAFTTTFIQPLGPAVIEMVGEIIPVFKGLFEHLEAFFTDLPGKI